MNNTRDTWNLNLFPQMNSLFYLYRVASFVWDRIAEPQSFYISQQKASRIKGRCLKSTLSKAVVANRSCLFLLIVPGPASPLPDLARYSRYGYTLVLKGLVFPQWKRRPLAVIGSRLFLYPGKCTTSQRFCQSPEMREFRTKGWGERSFARPGRKQIYADEGNNPSERLSEREGERD